MSKEKIKIRGLVCFSGWIFLAWGTLVFVKGFWDVFWGEPEANLYSLSKWEFISKEQWLTWSGFEIFYGIVCISIWRILIKYSRRLPEYIERERE